MKTKLLSFVFSVSLAFATGVALTYWHLRFDLYQASLTKACDQEVQRLNGLPTPAEGPSTQDAKTVCEPRSTGNGYYEFTGIAIDEETFKQDGAVCKYYFTGGTHPRRGIEPGRAYRVTVYRPSYATPGDRTYYFTGAVKLPGPASTSGANSPVVTGSGNNITLGYSDSDIGQRKAKK